MALHKILLVVLLCLLRNVFTANEKQEILAAMPATTPTAATTATAATAATAGTPSTTTTAAAPATAATPTASATAAGPAGAATPATPVTEATPVTAAAPKSSGHGDRNIPYEMFHIPNATHFSFAPSFAVKDNFEFGRKYR